MTAAAAHARPTRHSRPIFVLVAMSLGVLVAQVDTSVVSLAVKRIGADLGSGVSQMQWVIDAYNLVYASLLLTGGTLGDIYGRRRIFVAGIALFTVGTIVCALAPNGASLIAGRAISGLGAALELPMSLVLLTLAYPEAKSRAHALGIWASCNGLAFIIGPTLGGFLVDSAGWRSIFYLILPLCAAALLLTYAAVPKAPSRAAASSIWPGRRWPLWRSAVWRSPPSKAPIGDGRRYRPCPSPRWRWPPASCSSSSKAA